MTAVLYSLAAWALFNVLFLACFLYPVAMSGLADARESQRGERRRMRRAA